MERSRALATAVLIGALSVGPSIVVARADVSITVQEPALDSSLALASDAGRGVYWTANRIGGEVFAIQPDGATAGVVGYVAKPKDVEAMAYRQGVLYVADIGDLAASRDTVTVHGLSELGYATSSPHRAWDFRYPDGPRDASAFVLDDAGRMYIISREQDAGVYRAPAVPRRDQVNDLERVADAPAWVTDATLLPDGKLAMRTYTSVSVLDPSSFDTVAAAELPSPYLGSSLTTTIDGTALLVGDAVMDHMLLEVPIPTSGTSVSPAPSLPPTSPSPTPSPTNIPQSDEAAASSRRTGTMVALLAAGVLALLAGVVVAVRR